MDKLIKWLKQAISAFEKIGTDIKELKAGKVSKTGDEAVSGVKIWDNLQILKNSQRADFEVSSANKMVLIRDVISDTTSAANQAGAVHIQMPVISNIMFVMKADIYEYVADGSYSPVSLTINWYKGGSNVIVNNSVICDNPNRITSVGLGFNSNYSKFYFIIRKSNTLNYTVVRIKEVIAYNTLNDTVINTCSNRNNYSIEFKNDESGYVSSKEMLPPDFVLNYISNVPTTKSAAKYTGDVNSKELKGDHITFIGANAANKPTSTNGMLISKSTDKGVSGVHIFATGHTSTTVNQIFKRVWDNTTHGVEGYGDWVEVWSSSKYVNKIGDETIDGIKKFVKPVRVNNSIFNLFTKTGLSSAKIVKVTIPNYTFKARFVATNSSVNSIIEFKTSVGLKEGLAVISGSEVNSIQYILNEAGLYEIYISSNGISNLVCDILTCLSSGYTDVQYNELISNSKVESASSIPEGAVNIPLTVLGTSSVPTLQEVTDKGNTTTKSLQVGSGSRVITINPDNQDAITVVTDSSININQAGNIKFKHGSCSSTVAPNYIYISDGQALSVSLMNYALECRQTYTKHPVTGEYYQFESSHNPRGVFFTKYKTGNAAASWFNLSMDNGDGKVWVNMSDDVKQAFRSALGI